MPNMPSVAINGGTLRRAISSPLTRPAAQAAVKPTIAPASTTNQSGVPGGKRFIVIAATTDTMPIT